MQGKHGYQPELFATINLDDFVPTNHLVRKLDKVIDLSFVRELTKDLYADKIGRPSIDPEIFIRMNLIAYLYGIKSDRQLCEELQFNMAYRWYCRFSLTESIPDHSSMTKIRDRLGEKVFQEIFLKVINICKEKGLVKGEELMMDSSTIRANAALDTMVERKTPPTNCVVGKNSQNAKYVSPADPDATLFWKARVPHGLYYKVHTIIDPVHRIIVDSHVTTGTVHDGTLLIPRLEVVEKNLDKKVTFVTADRGYGAGDNQQYLLEQNIESNIPNFHIKDKTRFENFEYEQSENRFKCPAGKYLYPGKALNDGMRRYAMKKNGCKGCLLREKCGNRQFGPKHLNVNVHHVLQLEIAKKEETSVFKAKMSERMWKVEGLFAEAKNNHNLGRAKYRGMSKVQIQAYLISTVQNLKRLISSMSEFIAFLRYIFEKIEEKIKIENERPSNRRPFVIFS